MALQATEFYAETLMPNLRRKISITVQWSYSRSLSVDAGKAEVTFTAVKRGYPREFVIRLSSNLRGWRTYLYIAHEMVHVRQWAVGDLVDSGMTNHLLWRGHKTSDRDDGVAYWDFPWEHEAMALEFGLYAKLKAKFGYKQRDFYAIK